MIITNTREALSELGTARVGLEDLLDNAERMENNWRDDVIVSNRRVPIALTPDLKAAYTTNDGNTVTADLTENAFSQLCSRAGIPARYLKKCFDSGKTDLAIENWMAFSHDLVSPATVLKSRVYDDEIHAVVTDDYHPFSNVEILDGIMKAVDDSGRFEANQAFLSPDRMHVRFVDFNNPLKVAGDRLYSGFTVGSSNIGTGAFAIKYFLYRFACRNGIVRVQAGGILFRQTHLKEFISEPERLFGQALVKMHELDARSEKEIVRAQSRKLTQEEISMYLKRAQDELHIGKKGIEAVSDLIGTTYDPTLWGVINSLTESAQADNYGLDTRIDMETFAGKMLAAA